MYFFISSATKKSFKFFFFFNYNPIRVEKIFYNYVSYFSFSIAHATGLALYASSDFNWIYLLFSYFILHCYYTYALRLWLMVTSQPCRYFSMANFTTFNYFCGLTLPDCDRVPHTDGVRVRASKHCKKNNNFVSYAAYARKPLNR